MSPSLRSAATNGLRRTAISVPRGTLFSTSVRRHSGLKVCKPILGTCEHDPPSLCRARLFNAEFHLEEPQRSVYAPFVSSTLRSEGCVLARNAGKDDSVRRAPATAPIANPPSRPSSNTTANKPPQRRANVARNRNQATRHNALTARDRGRGRTSRRPQHRQSASPAHPNDESDHTLPGRQVGQPTATGRATTTRPQSPRYGCVIRRGLAIGVAGWCGSCDPRR